MRELSVKFLVTNKVRMTNPKDIGNAGEQLAKDYLIKNQYKILEENWRYKHKEIDLIACKNRYVCIVEVKTRSSDYIPPREAVNKKKQQNLIAAANEYVSENELDYDVRFDIIEVIMKKDTVEINHIIDAFTPQIN